MKIDHVYCLTYSATGTTDKVASAVAEAAAKKLGLSVESIGFTKPAQREEVRSFGEGDLVVVGTPTYAGKMPNKLLPDFQTKLVGGAAAIAVVTFGNRSFDNSLAELNAVLTNNGFAILAEPFFA